MEVITYMDSENEFIFKQRGNKSELKFVYYDEDEEKFCVMTVLMSDAQENERDSEPAPQPRRRRRDSSEEEKRP